jgi:hypothetical protein
MSVRENFSSCGLSQIAGRSAMSFDVNTLLIVTISVEAILGLLLLFAWAQNTQISAVAWWGCAHLLRAGSIALFGSHGSVSDTFTIDLANALLLLSFGLTWSGARIFGGRLPLPFYLVAGPLAWVICAHLPGIGDDLQMRILLSPGIITLYTWLAAYEFWRGGQSPWYRAGRPFSCWLRMARCSSCARRLC